jgi:ATP-dependent Clp protease, protease subunit
MTGDGPGSVAEVGDWLARNLFATRVVRLSGPLDDRSANDVVAQLMTLDALGDEPVELRIDSPTGTTGAALAVVDVIDLLGVPVHAFASGRVHGPALAVVAVCDRRTVAEHSSLRLVEPAAEFRGSARQLGALAAAHRDEWAALCGCVARAAGRPVEEVAADAAAGRFLTPDEAVEYGIADEVARRDAEIRPLPVRRIGFRPGGLP